MDDVGRQLNEVIDTATRHATGPEPAELRHRLRRRRRQRAAAAAMVVVALGAGILTVDRWLGWDASRPPTGGRPQPPATTLQPIDPARLFDDPESPRPVGPVRLMAEGTFKGRHWAFYLYRGRPAPPDPPGERWCEALVDWRSNGTLAGWSVGCSLVQQQLRAGRKLTLFLQEPVKNRVFVYHGGVTRQAARIRFQIGDQPPFEARIVDLGAQFPNNWYIAVFSPEGGTRTMLDRRVRQTVTVLDAAGHTICTTTVDTGGCG